MKKNLTPGHLAAKMGIATALVHSWEDGTTQPDNRQMEVLVNLLGFDAGDCGSFEEENGWLKCLVADQTVQIQILKEVNAKKW